MHSKKVFHLQLTQPDDNHYGCISNCDVKPCTGNFNLSRCVWVFRAALGYTAEIARTGLLFDEYIWEEYTKDHAPQSPEILQAKISEYLNAHCLTFWEHYKDKVTA